LGIYRFFAKSIYPDLAPSGAFPGQAHFREGKPRQRFHRFRVLANLSYAMNEPEQRQIARDSLFVMADIRFDGADELHRIKMRNLSSGGLMGEGSVRVQRGALLSVEIRNIGWVEGSIAWIQGDRFGVAFREEIDPKVVRAHIPASSHETPQHVRVLHDPASRILRKI
jgi:hypothetical protein